MKVVTEIDLLKLEEVFFPEWRIQSVYKDDAKATCVAYFKKEKAMQLLNNSLGSINWQRKHESIPYKGSECIITCKIGIKINEEWIWREDAGDAGQPNSDSEEKNLMTNSFKRACSSWGIGAYLYEIGFPPVQMNMSKSEGDRSNKKPFPVDPSLVNSRNKDGRIFNLTEYLNSDENVVKKINKFKKNYELRYQDLESKIGDTFDWFKYVKECAINELVLCNNIDSLRELRIKYTELEKQKVPEYTQLLKLKISQLNKGKQNV
jgi:hypothetical protein